MQPNSTTLLVKDEKERHNFRLSDISCSQITAGNKDLTVGESMFSPLASGANIMMGTFQSNVTKRMADAMMNHSSMQFKWLKQIELL